MDLQVIPRQYACYGYQRMVSAYTDLTLYIDKTANTTRGGTGSTNRLSPNAVFIGAFK
jgi:hypothetical protein